MDKKALFLWLVLVLLPGALLGYGYPASFGTGSSLAGLDAVTASLGGVTAVDLGGAGVLLNPSFLGLLRAPRIQMSVGPVLSKESIETPFGRFNVSTIALGSTGMTAAFPITDGIGCGVGISRLSDFSYKGEYYDYILQGPDTVVVFQQQNNSGSIWESSAGVGARLLEGLHAGASVGYRFGSGTWDFFQDTSVDSPFVDVETWEESGLAYRVGLSLIASRARIGAAYTNGMDKYPPRASLGFAIGDMTAWESSFGAEVEMQFPGDSTRFTARLFGGTPLSGNDLYGRAAVFMFESQGSDSREATGVCMGIGLKVSRTLVFDTAVSWINESRTGDVFGGYPQQATVNDTHSGLTAGLTWNP